MTDLLPADDIRLDTIMTALNQSVLSNPATGMGTGIDPYTQVRVTYSYLLSEQQLRALYRGSWYIRRVIEVPADDMTKAGVDVTLHGEGNPDLVGKALQIYRDGGQNVSPYSRRRSFGECFRQAEVWARLFGQSYCVLQVNKGEDPAKPLKRVRSIEGLTVLDRHALMPAVGTVNPDYPEFYQVGRVESPGDWGKDKYQGLGQRIHESRVLVFNGAKIHPYDVQLEGDGGHDSIVQQIWEVFVRHFMAKDAISKGLDSYSLFKVAINGLSTLMQAPKGTETLTKYLNTVAQQMSLHRILVQDTEASKSEFQERSFAGVAENFENFKQELTAATGLPHYKIWGSVDKAGLADSGGAESRAWAETVKAMQQRQFGDNHRRLFHAIFEALGEVPEQWEVEYPSIYTSTPEEEANLEKIKGDNLAALVREGIITGRQAYQAIATGQPIENVCEPLDEELVLNPVEQEEAEGPSAEEELTALLGGGGAADPAAGEALTEEPVEDVPGAESEGEVLPEEEEEPAAEEEPATDPEILPEDEPTEDLETLPEDEPTDLSAEQELAALVGEDPAEIEDIPVDDPMVEDLPTEEDELPEEGEDEDPESELAALLAEEDEDLTEALDSLTAEESLQYILGWHADKKGGGKGTGKKRGKRTQKPNCTKGRSCGFTCIPMKSKKTGKDTVCNADLSPAAEAVAKAISQGAGQGNPFDPAVNPLPPQRRGTPNPNQNPFDPATNPLPPQRYQVPQRRQAQQNFPELGRGGFGVVYLDRANNVALKYSVDPNDGVPASREELRIMQTASRLGVGPRLVGVNREALAMEYLEGYRTMKTRAMATLSPESQKQLARNMFSQLEKLHKADIAHGDFHSGNVMFDNRGNVKLIDFGLASRGDDFLPAPVEMDMQTASRMFNHIPVFRDAGVQAAIKAGEQNYTSPDEVFSRIYRALDEAQV